MHPLNNLLNFNWMSDSVKFKTIDVSSKHRWSFLLTLSFLYSHKNSNWIILIEIEKLRSGCELYLLAYQLSLYFFYSCKEITKSRNCYPYYSKCISFAYQMHIELNAFRFQR